MDNSGFSNRLPVGDTRAHPAQPEEALQVRDRLAHQVLNPEVWPVFDLQVGFVDGMPARLWLCLDNLLLDGLSMQILLSELEHGYRYPQQLPPPLPVTFRDYLQQPRCGRPIPTLWHGGKRSLMIFLRRLRYRYAACLRTLRRRASHGSMGQWTAHAGVA